MKIDSKLTLLSKEELWGVDHAGQLEVLQKYGTRSAITDLVILTGGGYEQTSPYHAPDDLTSKGRAGCIATKSYNDRGNVYCTHEDGNMYTLPCYNRSAVIRPLLLSPSVFDAVYNNRIEGYAGTQEVEYGEYPQYAPMLKTQINLENEYVNGTLQFTGKTFTFDKTKIENNNQAFQPITCQEYEFEERKYIRVKANSAYDSNGTFKLSNGETYKNDDYVWIEVSPVKWLVDDKTKGLVSKKGLLSGIRFSDYNREYTENFSNTEVGEFLNKYMLGDLTQDGDVPLVHEEKIELLKAKDLNRKKTAYNLNFDQVSEEDIIKGAIKSGVAVFLHGPSSEGKSARVKQIDPDCEIVYLRNITIEGLTGKSVYNQATGEMIDLPPTWLKKLQGKCSKEPDKLHILFFDEITNALPSIQGMAFNIVLDREVNGIWKLPENARIVAAGNDMEESLAANELAEPLFNRFAHVYIKTTTEGWLKWASENNIHPAIYSYIAYKKGSTLRSKYDGKKSNADPRKWEMASKMLYSTGTPAMLRSLLGEAITKEFIQFCSQQVITLDDVLSGNYTDADIQALTTSEKYAATMALLSVDSNELEKVRKFLANLGGEFVAIFDVLWSSENEYRLEKIAKLRSEYLASGD